MRAGTGYTYLVSIGASDPLLFGVAGTERMRLDTSGNLGIGSTIPTQKLDVAGNVNVSGTVVMSSAFTMRNRLINGGMDIWQRGTSLSTNNTSGYLADRFWCFSGLSTAATYSQATSIGLTGFNYALRAQRNSGNTGTAGLYVYQVIETNNCLSLAGNSITLSFYARAGANYSATSNLIYYQVAYGTGTDQGTASLLAGTWTGQTYQSTAFTGTLTTGWQRFTGTITLPSTATEISIIVYGVPTGTAGAADYFDITGVQLEAGSLVTPFERRPYGMELQLCQRYYQNIGSNLYGQTDSPTAFAVSIPFWIPMRTGPSLAVRTGYYFNVRYAGNDTSIVTPTVANVTSDSYGVWLQVTSSGIVNNYPVHSRHQNSGTNDFLAASAEL
jgi:hypothetical protein